jgi:hypothetical protein
MGKLARTEAASVSSFPTPKDEIETKFSKIKTMLLQ